MLRLLTMISTIVVLTLSASEMPPMPPMMANPSKAPQTKPAPKAPNLPAECTGMPPMIIFLPPPMEAELVKCKNALHKPKLDGVSKKLSQLSGKNVEIKSVKIANGFKELYAVKFVMNKKDRMMYCNSDLSSCIEGRRIDSKPITKQKKGK